MVTFNKINKYVYLESLNIYKQKLSYLHKTQKNMVETKLLKLVSQNKGANWPLMIINWMT